MYKSIHIEGSPIDRESLVFEGKEVVDGKFKDGSDLTDKQLRLLTQMNEIQDLV